MLLWAGPASAARPGDVLAEVLLRVQRDYVDAADLVPARLLDSALSHASESYAAVVVNGASSAGAERALGPWRLQVRDAAFLIGAREAEGWQAIGGTLGRVLAFLARAMPDTPQPEIETTLVAGLLRAVDPHSEFFTPRAYREFIGSTTGDITGIGLVVVQRDGIRVEEVLPGAPGERAGIRVGDRIAEIGSRFADALSMDEAVALLRGEPGQPVEVGVLSPGSSRPRRLRVVREAIHFPAAEGELLVYPEGSYGYIRLRAFQPDSTSAVRRLAEPWVRLQSRATAPLGIVLDMRGNPGGALSQAIDVSDLFLREGLIVKTVQPHRGGQSARASEETDDIGMPVVVLMDQRSASASEIVAAALKNHRRALLIGERSVGKGTVQSVLPLAGGNALKLTIAKYLTPGDRSIQGVGVTPHLLLRTIEAGPDRYRLRTELEPAGPAEERPLSAPPGLRADAPLAVVPVLAHPDAAAEPSQEGDKPSESDPALLLAREVLSAHRVREPGGIAAAALLVARERAAAYDAEIVRRLSAHGIDWRAPPPAPVPGAPASVPPSLASPLRVERAQAEVSTDGKFWRNAAEGAHAGDRLRLSLRVRNESGAPVARVLALLSVPGSGEPEWELPLGWIEPGSAIEREASWVLPESILPPAVPIDVRLVSQAKPGEEPLGHKRVFLPVLESGQIYYTAQIELEEEGDGDGRWERGESLSWSLRVTNPGALPSLGGRVLAEWPRPGIAAVLQDLPADLPRLDGGQTWTAHARLRRVSDEMIVPAFVAVRARAWGPDALPLEWRVPVVPEIPRGSLQFVPPEIAWEPLPEQAEGSLMLRGEARDERAMRSVTVRVNGRKTHYFEKAAQHRALAFQAELNLQPGWNRIQVEARDHDDLAARRAFGIWMGDTSVPVSGAPGR